MKLKAYHSLTLTSLFLTALIDLTFLGLTIYHFATVGSKVMDGIIYVVCFILLLAFNVLEIINTFFSFKDGSRFVKYLIFDDNNDIVTGVLVVTTIFALLGLFVMIYCIIIFTGLPILLSDLDSPMIYVAFSFACLIFFNAITILIFPWLGLEDKAMKIKVKKKRGADL